MAVTGYEMMTVAGDFCTLDLLVWRRYRIRAPGILEATLDANPHLATIHRYTPFIPPGIQIRLAIDPAILSGAPQMKPSITLWSAKLTN
jgi:phage tail protein X